MLTTDLPEVSVDGERTTTIEFTEAVAIDIVKACGLDPQEDFGKTLSPFNRPVSGKRIKQYSRAMQRGDWGLTGDCMELGVHARTRQIVEVRNAQHRTWARIAADGLPPGVAEPLIRVVLYDIPAADWPRKRPDSNYTKRDRGQVRTWRQTIRNHPMPLPDGTHGIPPQAGEIAGLIKLAHAVEASANLRLPADTSNYGDDDEKIHYYNNVGWERPLAAIQAASRIVDRPGGPKFSKTTLSTHIFLAERHLLPLYWDTMSFYTEMEIAVNGDPSWTLPVGTEPGLKPGNRLLFEKARAWTRSTKPSGQDQFDLLNKAMRFWLEGRVSKTSSSLAFDRRKEGHIPFVPPTDFWHSPPQS